MASSDEGKENRKPSSTLNGGGGRRVPGGTSGMLQNPPAGAILLMSQVLDCRLLQLSSVLKILYYASNKVVAHQFKERFLPFRTYKSMNL